MKMMVGRQGKPAVRGPSAGRLIARLRAGLCRWLAVWTLFTALAASAQTLYVSSVNGNRSIVSAPTR